MFADDTVNTAPNSNGLNNTSPYPRSFPIPVDLSAALYRAAKADGVTVATFIIESIESRLAAHRASESRAA